MGEFARSGRYYDFKVDDNPNGGTARKKGKNGLPFSQKRMQFGPKKKKIMTQEERKKLAITKKDAHKKRLLKKSRIIIRNLSFKVKEEELKKVLSACGTVVEVTIPRKPDGKMRGFAFAQFEKFKYAARAVKNLNFKEIRGRKVAIDYAISKNNYDHKVSSKKVKENDQGTSKDDDDESESAGSDEEPEIKTEDQSDDEEVDEDDKRVSEFMQEFDFKDEDKKADSDSQEDSDSDDDSVSGNSDSQSNDDEDADSDSDSVNEVQNSPKDSKKRSVKQENDEGEETSDIKPGKRQKTASNDVQEGKTVFVRNISFETTEDGFQEAMNEFGSFTYCILCMDPVTELPKGTAFVKFLEKSDAEKLINKSSNDEVGGIYLDGRRLYCSPALSREELSTKSQENMKVRHKDKRNLYLLKEGVIMVDSEEAKDMSPADQSKRTKLEMTKKQKLKNLNFFVSKTRLCVHNIPPNYTDGQLRKLFQKAAGHKAHIIEVRVMKDFKKIDAKNEAKSKGFGFVAFNRHEDALEAVRKLNNNPNVFTPQMRPIVEFSVENHQALLAKQRQRERNISRQKKRQEEEKEMKETNNITNTPTDIRNKTFKKKTKGNNKFDKPEWRDRNSVNASGKFGTNKKFKKVFNKKSPDAATRESPSPTKKTKKQNKRNARNLKMKGDTNFLKMVDNYKSKLLQKL